MIAMIMLAFLLTACCSVSALSLLGFCSWSLTGTLTSRVCASVRRVCWQSYMTK